MVEVGGSSPLASTKKAATLTGGGFFDTRKTEEPTAVRASAFLRDTFVRSTNSLSRRRVAAFLIHERPRINCGSRERVYARRFCT